MVSPPGAGADGDRRRGFRGAVIAAERVVASMRVLGDVDGEELVRLEGAGIMPYVYRYIDMTKEEVCYIGKITKYKDVGYDPLVNRHEQHRREEWYKAIGDENCILQYIEIDNHTDADILETWLIQYYDNGQLYNKSKTGWGKSRIDLYHVVSGRWRAYGCGTFRNREEIKKKLEVITDILMNGTEGLYYNLEPALEAFNERVRDMRNDILKAHKLSRYDMQDDFLRIKKVTA